MNLRSLIVIFIVLLCLPQTARADEVYPRLANYFLKWEMTASEAVELAKWDLVIVDMENQENNPEFLRQMRRLNPDIKILAYITPQEMIDNPENYQHATLRQRLAAQILDGWWLQDENGKSVVNWPHTAMFNLSEKVENNAQGRKLNEVLPRFVHEHLQSSGLWDGVFYDNLWGDISWMNNGHLDFNRDGVKDGSILADSLWVEGTAKLLRLSRELLGPNFIIIGNGRVHWAYQSLLNGMMLEGFPPTWENGGTWSGAMSSYAKLPVVNLQPNATIINVFKKNAEDYQAVRFGLTSALLGNGYYSFDYDVTNHGQTWWYDEYDVNLGKAQSAPYNLLNGGKSNWQPGLWRRDFKNGVAIVNSTDKVQSFVFSKEEFEKIKGLQAPNINNGLKINYLKLDPHDGVLLLKKLAAWQGSAFTNGGFLRIFTIDGDQSRNGFFSYVSSLPAGSEVLVGDFSHNGDIEYILSYQGQLMRQQSGKNLWSVQPFAAGFKGSASIAVADINGDGRVEIIIGAGQGGGPQVRVFTDSGKSLLNFFAYDKNFRGGVNVAAGDINGDGKAEIITGAGPGGGPQVRIFTDAGQALSSFFAYDKNFRGGINVGVSLVEGKAEIAVGIKGF